MKLAYFNDYRLGVVRDERIVDVTEALRGLPHLCDADLMSGLVADFAAYRETLEDMAAKQEGLLLDTVRLRAPLPRPRNIVCMAVNYRENGARREVPPINAFTKPASAVIGCGDAMELPDLPALVFEGEAELAVVFGRTARNVSRDEAMDFVFGYANFIDGSARGLGPDRNVYYAMKAHDTFAPMGPFLVTRDEIADPQKLRVRSWCNGEIRQDYNSDDMVYPVAECVAWVTSIHTMYPGDVLALGTNHGGLHAYMNGDRIEMETEGLGRLSFVVRDTLDRTWTRETHLDREKAGFSGTRNLWAPQLTGKYTPQ